MITETIGSITIVLPETEGLFSPRGLDRGTRAMLELYPPEPGWRVLDLGCGAGPVGIYAAKTRRGERGDGRHRPACPCPPPRATPRRTG